MTKHIEREIESLKKKILALSAIVKESVDHAVASIVQRDERLARTVIDTDVVIDQMEVMIEEDSLKILALYQPVAIDLRFVIAVLKINNDLERIGDLAVNIAEQTLYLVTQSMTEMPIDVETMAEKAQAMLQRALDALVEMDTDLAREVCRADDEVDDIHRETYRIIEQRVRANPDTVEYQIHYLTVSRCLERIADYATNVAEDVIYMIEGHIIRHQKASFGGAQEI